MAYRHNSNGLRLHKAAWREVVVILRGVCPTISDKALAIAEDIFARGMWSEEVQKKRHVSAPGVWDVKNRVWAAIELVGLEWPMPRPEELREDATRRLLANEKLRRVCPYQWYGDCLLSDEEIAALRRQTRERVARVLRTLNFDDLFRFNVADDKKQRLRLTRCRVKRLEKLTPEMSAARERLLELGFLWKRKCSSTKSRYFESRMAE